MKIIKKDESLADYDFTKIKNAVTKSANRVNVKLSDEDWKNIQGYVEKEMASYYSDLIPVSQMHVFVELALDKTNSKVAKSYRDYRNYKQDFVRMMDEMAEIHDRKSM